MIERAVVLTPGPRHRRRADSGPRAEGAGFPGAAVRRCPPEGISFKDVTSDFEKRLIESTLEQAGGVQKRAAELLQIKPTTLNEMIKRLDIHPRRRKTSANDADPIGADSTEPLQPVAPTVTLPLAALMEDKYLEEAPAVVAATVFAVPLHGQRAIPTGSTDHDCACLTRSKTHQSHHHSPGNSLFWRIRSHLERRGEHSFGTTSLPTAEAENRHGIHGKRP